MLRALPRLLRAAGRFFFTELDLERKSCLTNLVWGGLILALDPFAVLSSPGARNLSLVANWVSLTPAILWGSLALAVGTTQFVGLVSGRRGWRRAGAIFGFSLWTTVCLTIVLANPHTAAPGTFGLFAWSGAALYFQLGTGRRS